MPRQNPPTFRGLLREYRTFFIAMGLFLAVGAVILLWIDRGDAVLFFSRSRTALLNQFFIFVTGMGEELAFILSFVALLFVSYRQAIAIPLMALGVTLVAFVTKTIFAHDRPYAYFRKIGLADRISIVEGIEPHEGATSFPSGHTMAAFALYAFLSFCLSERHRGWGGAAFFSLAVLVGMSRIYLVQHFFKDIYLGAIFGLLIAMVFYVGQYRVAKTPHRWLDDRVGNW